MPRKRKMYFERDRRRKSPVEEDGSFGMGPGFVFDPDGFYVRPVARRKKPKKK